MSAPPLSRIPWPPILLIAAVTGATAASAYYPLGWPGLDDLPARVIGLAFGFAGVMLIGWSAMALRRQGTTVLPTGTSTALVTDGPYRFRRNPIYLGWVLLLLCAAEMTKNIWFVLAAALFAVLVTVLAIIPEERHLEGTFGDAYRDYKTRTRRWI